MEGLVSVVCGVLQQSTYQLTVPSGEVDGNTDIKLKLQVVCVGVLEELVRSLDRPEMWLPWLQHHLILPSLLASVSNWIKVKIKLYSETSVRDL